MVQLGHHLETVKDRDKLLVVEEIGSVFTLFKSVSSAVLTSRVFHVSAPDGCLQYFTGVSGQILSFNYNSGSGLQLSNTDYSVCVRMERNFCGIQYNACADTGENIVSLKLMLTCMFS